MASMSLGLVEGITIVIVLGAALTLLVWGVARALPTDTLLVKRSFWCPFRKQNVTAEFRQEAWDRTLLAVNRCTAFTPETAVTCEKSCLRLPSLPSVRTKAEAA